MQPGRGQDAARTLPIHGQDVDRLLFYGYTGIWFGVTPKRERHEVTTVLRVYDLGTRSCENAIRSPLFYGYMMWDAQDVCRTWPRCVARMCGARA